MASSGRPAAVDPLAYLADPYAELRRVAAEHWIAEGVDADGGPLPIAVGHAGVRNALRDPALSARSFTDDMVAAGLERETAEQFTPLFRRHGDEHRAFRGLLSAAFTPRSVERLRPVAAAVAERLADQIEESGGPCEFVDAFAAPLPPEVFAVLFGLPVEDRDDLARWATTVSRAFTLDLTPRAVVEVEAVAAELRIYCAALIEQRRSDPGDDLVSQLLAAEVEGRRLSDRDVIATVTAFIFAGAETTKRQLTAMVLALTTCEEAWDGVAADQSLLGGAVEEVLRHASIVPGLSRVALCPVDDDGLTLATGDRMVVSFESANRDDRVFTDADSFDIGRPNADQHVTFGWGPHFCMGAGLARVELQEALRTLTRRFAPPALVEEGPVAIGGLRAPDSLVVLLTPRSRATA